MLSAQVTAEQAGAGLRLQLEFGHILNDISGVGGDFVYILKGQQPNFLL